MIVRTFSSRPTLLRRSSVKGHEVLPERYAPMFGVVHGSVDDRSADSSLIDDIGVRATRRTLRRGGPDRGGRLHRPSHRRAYGERPPADCGTRPPPVTGRARSAGAVRVGAPVNDKRLDSGTPVIGRSSPRRSCRPARKT